MNATLPSDRSRPQEHLDRVALVHRAVGVGGLIERQGEIEDLAWLDPAVPDEVRFHHPLVGDLDLVFEAATLRADPGLTLLLATAERGSPTEAALHRLSATARSRQTQRR